MNSIKLLLADDQSLIRDGLKTVLGLEKDIEVVGTARNGVEACRMTEILQPDVLLLDIRMPEMNGVECIKVIKKEYPGVKVIMLTTFNDDEYIVEALANGASGYILKDIEMEKLIEAIHDAVHGKMIMYSNVAARLAENLCKLPLGKKKEENITCSLGFSVREKEIACMMVQGFTNKQISAALYMSEGTVRNYISNIYSKIGITDRTQAVLFLKEHGIS